MSFKSHDYTLYLLCAKWNNNNNKWKKMSENRFEKNKHNFLSFKKLFMSYYICSCNLNATFQRMCPTF
jgi:hypothetical protein